MTSYDVVTVGAGHAGIESSFAAARLGLDSALLTLDLRAIGMRTGARPRAQSK